MTTHASGSPLRHPGATLALICVAMFMLMLDMTIVAVAMPDIQQDLHSSLSDLQWVVDAYTLPLAALLLTAATMGDRIGRRRIFLLGMAIFTAGSLACALSMNPLSLNIMRALQGIGAAMLFGTAMPILGDAFPDTIKRAKAIGIFGATLAGATAMGPILGGAIVDSIGWQWIFAINVPIGLIALVLGLRFVHESRSTAPRRADWWGTVLLTVSLGALVFGLIRGQAEGWGSGVIVASFIVAVAALGAFIYRSQVIAEPMVDLALFGKPAFVAISITGLLIAGTIVAATNYIGLYFVNTLGHSPFIAGVYTLPLTITSFVAAPISARLHGKVPTGIILTVSLLTVAAGLLWCAQIDASSHWYAMTGGFIVAGIGLGASSATLAQAALQTVEPNRAGMATGVVNTMRQVGVAAGVATFGAIFSAQVHDRVTAAVGNLPGDTTARLADAVASGAGRLVGNGAPPALHDRAIAVAIDATAHGMSTILWVGAIAVFVGAVAVAALMRPQATQPTPPRELSTDIAA